MTRSLQLFTCLVLKQFFKKDDRGIVAILQDHSDLRGDLGLSRVPHFTCLQKAEAKLLTDERIMGLLVATGLHFILGMLPGLGPKPDINELIPTMERLPGNVVIRQVLADAGYDSEGNHEACRERYEMDSMESMIPPLVGRATDKLPIGKYRCQMVLDFKEDEYGQRWQVETVNSMMKRHLGSSIAARNEDARLRELEL